MSRPAREAAPVIPHVGPADAPWDRNIDRPRPDLIEQIIRPGKAAMPHPDNVLRSGSGRADIPAG
ncbi:MAG: hypothetical protein ACR2JP_09085 [Acidimicrobiia bacterium]